MLKKPIKRVQPKSELNQAYELVAQDLYSALKKAKDGAIIKLGSCGTFHKKRTRVQNPYGAAYLYYRIMVAAVCVGLYFYGQQIKKDNDHSITQIMNNFNNQQNQEQNQLNNQSPNQEPSGLMKMVGQSLPFLPLLFEQFTGQKVPQMSGTMFEIQMALNQILSNQQSLNQRLIALENNASQQFTNLVQQVQSIKSVRLTHDRERKQIDYNLQQADEANKY
ncbi:2547_t:CDS:2 [Ambispora gerdemannii]|uniref:2547_t:CDS:1 n=1 Tax=Ambispora gerdemannii TaxID=144530 RepID=A0A9N9EGE5_9GLOM|nr:2547_t:CDS:2 [Ambispora gerdemannii]